MLADCLEPSVESSEPSFENVTTVESSEPPAIESSEPLADNEFREYRRTSKLGQCIVGQFRMLWNRSECLKFEANKLQSENCQKKSPATHSV